MSYKSLKSIKAKQAKQEAQAQTAAEKRISRRSLVILGVFVLLILSIGALAHWRNLLAIDSTNKANSSFSSSKALVAGTPPPMPANQASKEFINSPYAGV